MFTNPLCPFEYVAVFASVDGHDEQSFPSMGRADFRRREYSRHNPVTHAVKIGADRIEAEG
jgi:hypothetical protein